MNDNPNRRKDDARPAVALQWGDRPDQWTLLLTGPATGLIGPLGSTWPNQPADLERVDVCVRRKDGPAGVFRTGGEAPTTWHQFYPLGEVGQQLRDGEYLYQEGAPPKLEDIEQYRMQMAGISTASLGYWKLGDSIHPDYDTVPLRDVAALFQKYDQLYKFRSQVRDMLHLLKKREWAEDLAATGDAAELQSAITDLVGAVQTRMPGDWSITWDEYSPPHTIRLNSPKWGGCFLSPPEPDDIGLHALAYRMLSDFLTAAALAAPDAVDAALADAIQHGTGAFAVNTDGSTEHIAFVMPPMVHDALYPDYVVPAARAAAKSLRDEVIGCFNAAEIEGLTEALASTSDERLKDLVERRLMHALYAAQGEASTAATQPEQAIAWMKPDEIAGLLDAASKRAGARHYGRVYARQYDPDMVPVAALAIPASTARIPVNVYYSAENDNFYSDNGEGMGQGFYERWEDRKSEFPSAPASTAASEQQAGADELPPTTIVPRPDPHMTLSEAEGSDGYPVYTILQLQHFAREYARAALTHRAILKATP